MQIELYRENLSDCVGKVVKVDDHWVSVDNDIGLVNRKCCVGFKPKESDVVVLGKNENGFVLMKYWGKV